MLRLEREAEEAARKLEEQRLQEELEAASPMLKHKRCPSHRNKDST